MSAKASSKCPQCFTGNCRVHPNQDGGKKTAELLEKLGDKVALQKRLYDSVVKKQLEKLSKEEGRTKSAEDSNAYRADLDKERRRAEKRKNRLTPEQQAKAKNLKLGGHLLGMMLEGSDSEDRMGSDSDGEKRKKRKKKDKKRKKREKKRRREMKKRRKEADTISRSSSASSVL
eukprot:313456_1